MIFWVGWGWVLYTYVRLRTLQSFNKEGIGNHRDGKKADKVSLHLILHYLKLVLEAEPLNLGGGKS